MSNQFEDTKGAQVLENGRNTQDDSRSTTMTTAVKMDGELRHNSTNCIQDVTKKDELLYSVEESPPWALCIPLSIQQYLTMFSSTMIAPYLMAPALCIPADHIAYAYILSNIIFVSGLTTILQSTLGVRLPVIQGSSVAFYPPMYALMALPEWTCPYNESTLTRGTPANYSDDIWHSRMCEVQGAIAVAGLLPMFLSITGLFNILIRYISPLVVVPTITLVGISLFDTGSSMASKNWWIAIATIVILLLFCLYLRNIRIPYPKYSWEKRGLTIGWFHFFKFFPIIATLAIMWLICYILTITDTLHQGDKARTDVKSGIITRAPWFRFPYPLQWGMPTVSVAGVFGMMAAVIACSIESVGGYYACARISGAPIPPPHAISRGILVEGFGCTLAGLWGTGTGTTTYGENISTISITRVGSRRVIQVATIVMFLFGVVTKIGAIFVAIPEPVIGGLFIVMFGMITAVGLSNLQDIDLNSSRNLLILGFSIFFGLTIPNWVKSHRESIYTGIGTLDNVLIVLLESPMLIGGVVSFVLDNTVSGTPEERGLIAWHAMSTTSDTTSKKRSSNTYDFPCGMSWINRQKMFRYVPVCPPFRPVQCGRRKSSSQLESAARYNDAFVANEDTTL